MPTSEANNQRVGLGVAIRSFREAGHWSAAALAKRANVDRQWLAEIENGKADLTWSDLRALASGFVVTLPQLTEVAEYFAQNDPECDECPGSRLPGWGRSRRQLPPPFSDYELSGVTPRERYVLKQRYGLGDGISRNFAEIAKRQGFSEGRARAVVNAALVKVRRQRDLRTSFDAGMRMVGAERSEGLLPAPFAKGGIGRRRKLFPGAQNQVSRELVAARFRVTGSGWSLDPAFGSDTSEDGWVVFCGEGTDGRLICASRDGGRNIREPRVLGVISKCQDGRAIRGWLERMAFEHQKGKQSLAFLVGGLSALLERDACLSSAEDFETALASEVRWSYPVEKALAKLGTGPTL